MPVSQSTDKIIVDRRKSVRNKELRNTLLKTREQLALRGEVDDDFERELLAMHANALVSSIAAVPLLIIITGLAGLGIGFGPDIIVWAFIANLLYVSMGLLSKRYLARKSDISLAGWRRAFIMMHAVTGFSWIYFALNTCSACGTDEVLFYKASIILVAIAATASIGYTVRFAIIAAFSVPVAAFSIFNMWNGTGGTLASAMLISSLLFFTFVSIRLNRNAVATLGYRAQNNALIAELEMAKSISDEARRRAEDANLAKSRFLASMSHELRTPLNAILGFSEAMQNEMLGPVGNEAYKGYVSDIHESGRHLLDLINEILDLSRIEAGKYDLKEEPLRLADVAEDCMALVRLRSTQKALNVKAVFQDGLPKVLADEKAVRQIVLNMLSNAVKFTPSGGRIEVKVGWTASGGQYVAVKDNGPGIPEEEIPIVLSAFGQGSIAIKSAEQGTGLGLPIVQALLAMHGGTFVLRSKLREGTEAIAMFPASRTLQSMAAEPVTEPAKQPRTIKAARQIQQA